MRREELTEYFSRSRVAIQRVYGESRDGLRRQVENRVQYVAGVRPIVICGGKEFHRLTSTVISQQCHKRYIGE